MVWSVLITFLDPLYIFISHTALIPVKKKNSQLRRDKSQSRNPSKQKCVLPQTQQHIKIIP